MKRLLLAAASLAVAGSSPAVSGAEVPVSQLRCDVAWSHIERILAAVNGHRVVFATEPFFFLELPNPATPWVRAGGDWTVHVPPPPADLVAGLTAESALHACSSIRRRLDAMHIRFGPRAVAWATRVPRNRPFRATILSLSLPSVSGEGRNAVMGRSETRGQLDGGAGLVHLVRDEAGAWQAFAEIGLWVS